MSKSSPSSRKLSLCMDKEVIEAFKIFDKDKDGKISRQEIVDLISSLGGDPECRHVQVFLTAADKNPLDTKQFMSLWKDFKATVDPEANEETEDEIQSAFKDYDINGDGYITKDEMVQAMGKMGFVSNKEEEARRCLEDMDLDGDGRVSYAEFMVKWRIT